MQGLLGSSSADAGAKAWGEAAMKVVTGGLRGRDVHSVAVMAAVASTAAGGQPAHVEL